MDRKRECSFILLVSCLLVILIVLSKFCTAIYDFDCNFLFIMNIFAIGRLHYVAVSYINIICKDLSLKSIVGKYIKSTT